MWGPLHTAEGGGEGDVGTTTWRNLQIPERVPAESGAEGDFKQN